MPFCEAFLKFLVNTSSMFDKSSLGKGVHFFEEGNRGSISPSFIFGI